jgi:hypothetical protein
MLTPRSHCSVCGKTVLAKQHSSALSFIDGLHKQLTRLYGRASVTTSKRLVVAMTKAESAYREPIDPKKHATTIDVGEGEQRTE